MHDVEFADFMMKRPVQGRCPTESSDHGASEISDLNAVNLHRCSDWSGANSWSVDVSGKDLHFVPSCRQCSAEANGSRRLIPHSARPANRSEPRGGYALRRP